MPPASFSEIDDVRMELVDPILQIVKAPYVDKSRDCTFENAVPCHYRIVADKSRLYAILYNLLKNAMKACCRLVYIGCDDTGGHVEFRIGDDGEGISVLRIPAFVTPERLGLHIVNTCVSSLGGSLTFERPKDSNLTTVVVVRIPKGEYEHE